MKKLSVSVWISIAVLVLPISALAQDEEDYGGDEETLASMIAVGIQDHCECPEDASEKSMKRLDKCLAAQQKCLRGKMSKILKYLSFSSSLFKSALASEITAYKELCLSDGLEDDEDGDDEDFPRDEFPGDDMPGDEMPRDPTPDDGMPGDGMPDGGGDLPPPPPPR